MRALGLAALLLGVGLGVVLAQDGTKTVADPPAKKDPRDYTDRIWNFSWEGKKDKGDVLELAKCEGRSLVITHFELRQRITMRLSIVEYFKPPKKKRWKPRVRRSDLFSLGGREATSKYMASGFSTYTGLRFEPGVRPSLIVTQGGGDFAVYAEGYWSK